MLCSFMTICSHSSSPFYPTTMDNSSRIKHYVITTNVSRMGLKRILETPYKCIHSFKKYGGEIYSHKWSCINKYQWTAQVSRWLQISWEVLWPLIESIPHWVVEQATLPTTRNYNKNFRMSVYIKSCLPWF